MSRIKSISKGDGVVILELEREESATPFIQAILRDLGIPHKKRKNLFKGCVGVNKLELGRKGVGDYEDSIQYVAGRGLAVDVFTGGKRIFLVIHHTNRMHSTVVAILQKLESLDQK